MKIMYRCDSSFGIYSFADMVHGYSAAAYRILGKQYDGTRFWCEAVVSSRDGLIWEYIWKGHKSFNNFDLAHQSLLQELHNDGWTILSQESADKLQNFL